MTVTLEQLQGRTARCGRGCGNTKPSSELQGDNFFEYRGLGSYSSTLCRKCGYAPAAHEYDANRVVPEPRDCDYEPTPEGKEFDSFYCGCGGWD